MWLSLVFTQLLSHAFRSLSQRGNDRNGFLADDPARETFAKGLVEVSQPLISFALLGLFLTPRQVLDCDVKRPQQNRSWGSGGQADRGFVRRY